jgi:flagellar hook-basal body complex protein FliE
MAFAIPGIPTMSVGPEPTVAPQVGTAPASGASPTPPGATAPAGSAGGGDFLDKLGHALDELQQVQTNANEQAIGVAAGTANVADFMISAEQATLATQLTQALMTQAATAFNAIMDMQL